MFCKMPKNKKNIVIVAGVNELKSSVFLLYYLTVLVYNKTTIHLGVNS